MNIFEALQSFLKITVEKCDSMLLDCDKVLRINDYANIFCLFEKRYLNLSTITVDLNLITI